MIAIRRQCLEPSELRQVIDGALDKAQFDSAISHLDHCQTCRSAAESMSDVPRVLPVEDAIDQPSQDLQNETACQIALQNLLHSTPALTTAARTQSIPLESLGPYRIKELIGSGGMGAVYLAEHQRLKRQCAIKLLPPERVTQAGWLERFDREMTTIASLQHPHIVHATDAGHESGWHYLVMEHLDGLDIGRIASRMGQLDVADACEVIRQAALGLAHIHDSGLVHRDIKPSNLMLTRSGTVKLLDLGLVLDGDDPLSKDDRLTTVGHVMGTMPYMAPEQLADSRDVRPQSDIYSLGATFYRLIAGHPPHRSGRGLAAQVLAITSQDATPLDVIREDVDREIVALVAKMLSRDPEKRPASAAVVAQQLQPAAKLHRLQRLVRDAIRKQDADDLVHSGWLPSLPKQSTHNRRWSNGHVMLGIAAAALLMIAAVVFKIQTDRGDLIVHSEQDGLSIVIKQGDTVVEKLLVNSGTDNRTTLRKGTYQVEIEGGKAIQLSEEVVTIGRGTNKTIDVISQAELGTSDAIALDTSSTINPLHAGSVDGPESAGETGGQLQPEPLGVTTMGPAVTHSSIGQFPTTSSGSYAGMPLEHWLEKVQTEQNVEALCESAFAVVASIQDAKSRGLTFDTNAQQVVNALFERSREFGGIHSSLPPLPGTQSQPISDSEHFMWCLAQVFSEPDARIWWDAAIEELIDGNVHSRSAAIYCLLQDVHQGGMEQLGLAGGMSGYTYYAPDGKNTLAKFTISKLMRCCISLASEEVWAEMESHESARVASMARELAIVMLTSTSIAFSQEIHERLRTIIRAIPEQQRSELEQSFLPESAWATPEPPQDMYAGSPAMETDGTPLAEPGMPLESSDSYTPTPAKASPNLYQGRDLENWMDALDRERDVQTLGETMKAVETLTRESDDATRREAARRTMMVARRLGGIFSRGNETVPSHQFMTLFPSIFMRYLPESGVDVISQELVDGNRTSQAAALGVLRDHLDSNGYPWSSSRLSQSAASWINETRATEQGRDQLSVLRGRIMDVADAMEALDPNAEVFFPGENQSIASMAQHAALRLNALMAAPVDEEARIKDFVIDQVTKAQSTSQSETTTIGFVIERVALDDLILAAAVELAERDSEFGSTECLDFLLHHFASAPPISGSISGFGGAPKISHDKQTAFEGLKRAAPHRLLDTIHQTLQNPTETIARINWFAMTIPYYAANYPVPGDAAAVLESFRSNLEAHVGSVPELLTGAIAGGLKVIRARDGEQPTSVE